MGKLSESIISANWRASSQIASWLVICWSLVGSASVSLAQEQVAKEDVGAKVTIDFQTDVLPIFENHCFSCHGPETQESNFRLDVRTVAMAPADFGSPTIVPRDRIKSSLFTYISDPESDTNMPPGDAKPLTDSQVQTIGRWIDQGAIWPDALAGENKPKLQTDHWSFQPINIQTIPDLKGTAWPVNNPIDRFVWDILRHKGLAPSPKADRVSWIRRVYLNMHGLLPTDQQVQAFKQDKSQDACRKVIDSILDSPHYGERWARHWLDVVRFGESTGYEVNRDRANAFYYRDYVIESLNEDKSYRDFVIEQIAGDAVGVDEATGFLVGGPHDIVKSPDINLTLMQREDELADYVNTTSTAFLGLTVGCARCHNHKFDPILQRDYYAMQAVFSGVRHGERRLFSTASEEQRTELALAKKQRDELETFIADRRAATPKKPQTPNDQPLSTVNAKSNMDAFQPVAAQFIRFTVSKTNSGEPCLDELEIFAADSDRNVGLASAGGKPSSSGDYPNNPKHQLEHINDGAHGNLNSWISNTPGSGWIEIELAEVTEIDRVVWGRDREGQFSDRLAIEYKIETSRDQQDWTVVSSSKLRKPYSAAVSDSEDAFIAWLPENEAAAVRSKFDQMLELRELATTLEQQVPIGYVGTFAKPSKIHRLHRGDPMSPREETPPDALTVLGTLGLTSQTPEQLRRLEFAKWIASPENPLTARVIVNRVWHYHFGRGIVATPSDFGKNGIAPTHPELLDWLAAEFMNQGWSLKWLHRQILSSATYAQSSRPNQQAIALDADTHYLWRFPPKRLEAEAIRDCVLQVTGKLNSQAGGPGFLLFKIDRENVHHYFPLETFGPEHFRRMIYMTKIRQEQDEVFGVFDCPDGGQVIPNRSRSTTPLQALNLLNSRFMIEQAKFWAARLTSEAGDSPQLQVTQAFEVMFFRKPAPAELKAAVALIESHGLESFCRAMLNANEFLFVS
ncbi:MAG: hypothetical protein ACI87E_002551 [Mariniblastus sp.]|jgi:hypothetical protein